MLAVGIFGCDLVRSGAASLGSINAPLIVERIEACLWAKGWTLALGEASPGEWKMPRSLSASLEKTESAS